MPPVCSASSMRDERKGQRVAAETRLFEAGPDGPLAVCVVYPNVYRVAMGNLGFQAVYRMLAEDPRVTADRAYLPDPADARGRRRLRSFERDRPVGDFAIVAFSISFETDYVHVLACLDAAGIPRRRRERGPGHPLILAGGPATFLNPEPLADFVDLFLLGEAEGMLDEFVARGARTAGGRAALLECAVGLGGAYRPDHWHPRYDEAGVLAGVDHLGPGDGRVVRRYLASLDDAPTESAILSDDAVFGDMVMVEASRGCEWGCRFCAAGFMYRPVRYRHPDVVRRGALGGLAHRGTIGLVGAEMASQPGIASLCRDVVAAGGRPSPSSLKADVITPALAAALGRAGTRSVTIAPEAGSERMRRVINKNLTEDEILRAADWLVGGGVDALKLYVMVGLPTETPDDVDGIPDLVAAVRARLVAGGRPRVGKILVSINPFVPKPWTPLQWEPMGRIADLKRTLAHVRRRLARVPGVTVDTESPREAYLQTLLSRGDRRVGAVLERLRDGPEWWAALREAQRARAAGVDLDHFVHRRYPLDECLPWDFIDHAVDKRYLAAEHRKAMLERQTPPCDTHTCHACGAC